jgi:hypothetical protein
MCMWNPISYWNSLVPAFSLAEPHDALIGRDKPRRKLGNELKAHLDELGRSEQCRQVPDAFKHLVRILLAAGATEREGLKRTLDLILGAAEVIPLSPKILDQAGPFQDEVWAMPAKDSIVLASVLSHLEQTHLTESCFLNRNTKDFDNPGVRRMLELYDCKFFGSFEAGLDYIESRLKAS